MPCLAQSSEAGRGLHFTNSEENHSVGLRTPPSEDALKHGIGLVTSETEYTLCDCREKTCVLGERAKPQGRLDKSILYFIHVFFCTDFDKCQMLKNDSCQVMLLKFLKTFYIKRHHLLEFKDCKWWFAEWPGTHSLPTLANHATILSCQVCHWHWRGGLSHYGSWQWSPHEGPRPGQPQEGEGAARDGGPLPRHAQETHQAQDQRGYADCSGTRSNVNTVTSDWSSPSSSVLSLAALNNRVLTAGGGAALGVQQPEPAEVRVQPRHAGRVREAAVRHNQGES